MNAGCCIRRARLRFVRQSLQSQALPTVPNEAVSDAELRRPRTVQEDDIAILHAKSEISEHFLAVHGEACNAAIGTKGHHARISYPQVAAGEGARVDRLALRADSNDQQWCARTTSPYRKPVRSLVCRDPQLTPATRSPEGRLQKALLAVSLPSLASVPPSSVTHQLQRWLSPAALRFRSLMRISEICTRHAGERCCYKQRQ